MRFPSTLFASVGLALAASACSPANWASGPPIATPGAPGDTTPLDPEDPAELAPIAQASVQVASFRAIARSANLASGFGVPEVPAPTTAAVFEAGVLGHDPQVAVGDRFVFVYTAHRYQLLDKATGRTLEASGEVPSVGDFSGIFEPVWAPRDRDGAPNPANINSRLRFTAADPLACDAESPTRSNACVQEFYDTRVLWDAQRKRFWVESAARNHLWECAEGRCQGEKQSRTQARRYIAIAVSRTEDPRQGFHHYVLVDEYADWPKIGLNERYLILSHRASPWLYVFDADRLAAGNPERSRVRVAKIDVRRIPGVRYFSPVWHHGPTNGATWLLGSDGSDEVVPFALVNPDPNRAAPPLVVVGPRVPVGVKLGTLENSAVLRNGFLYWTFDRWAPGHERDYRHVHVLRMPVSLGGSPPAISASSDAAKGFRDTILGDREPGESADDVFDYEKPALDVNKDGTAVVVLSRRGYRTRLPVAPEVRYSIIAHAEPRARPAVLLRSGSWRGVPDIDDNGKAGIDLAFAQVDPSDDTSVWVTHAYSDAASKWYRQIVGVVKP